MGPYKLLRNWVDDYPIPYGNGNFMGVEFRPDRTFFVGEAEGKSDFFGEISVGWSPFPVIVEMKV